MNRKVAAALLDMYNLAASQKAASVKEVVNKFTQRKVTEPLVQSSNLYGKVPAGGHILDGDLPHKHSTDEIIQELLNEPL